MKILKYIGISLLTFSCATHRSPFFANKKVSEIVIGDTLIRSIGSSKFYNPLRGSLDTLVNPANLNALPIRIEARTSALDQCGYYTVHISDSLLYLKCDLNKNEITGLCNVYSLIQSDNVRFTFAILNGSIDGELIEYKDRTVYRVCIYRRGKLIRCTKM